MKTWSDVRDQLTSLTEEQKEQSQISADLISTIVKRRNELGLSQRQLADKCGIHYVAIARLEKNGVIPRIDTLSKIVKPLGLRIKLELTDS
jgi:predicted transcriptional regulator